MNEKYIASDDEISNILLEMRQSDIRSMIEIWNKISSNWSVESVSQVHGSLYMSGHIQEMIEHILECSKGKSIEAVS